MSGAGQAGGDGLLRVHLTWDPGPEADPAQTERLGRQLRADLQDLDVDDVTRVAGGAAPPGAKSVDVGAVGELLVTMSASGGVLATVVATLRGWLARRDDAAAVKLTIDGDTLELGRASAEERSDLIRAFVQSHQRS
jgi:Effector Associated Constant Component 1